MRSPQLPMIISGGTPGSTDTDEASLLSFNAPPLTPGYVCKGRRRRLLWVHTLHGIYHPFLNTQTILAHSPRCVFTSKSSAMAAYPHVICTYENEATSKLGWSH